MMLLKRLRRWSDNLDKAFNLKIGTPDEEFFQGEVISLNCETTDGRRGILANHCSMLAALIPTKTRFEDTTGKKYEANTSQGILKVRKNQVIILCDYAKW